MGEAMTTALTDPKSLLPSLTFTPDQVKLIRDTVAKGTTDDEFALFLYTARHTGLNPLLRQIHAVKRWDSKLEREAMAIQTGIDGYRLLAERTKKYAPGRETVFVEGEDGALVSATAYVKKLTEDGTWHEVSATAYYSEYVQLKKDGNPNAMWLKMPHSQLAKCAEALALRKGFPAETGDVRTDEEMGQADNVVETTAKAEPIKEPEAKPETPTGDLISDAQGRRLYAIWKGAGKKDEEVLAYLHQEYRIDSTRKIKKSDYEAICKWAGEKA